MNDDHGQVSSASVRGDLPDPDRGGTRGIARRHSHAWHPPAGLLSGQNVGKNNFVYLTGLHWDRWDAHSAHGTGQYRGFDLKEHKAEVTLSDSVQRLYTRFAVRAADGGWHMRGRFELQG